MPHRCVLLSEQLTVRGGLCDGRRVFRSCGNLLIIGLLTLTLGLHWMFLQYAAWVGMIASFSSDCSLGEAVSKALDGPPPSPPPRSPVVG